MTYPYTPPELDSRTERCLMEAMVEANTAARQVEIQRKLCDDLAVLRADHAAWMAANFPTSRHGAAGDVA